MCVYRQSSNIHSHATLPTLRNALYFQNCDVLTSIGNKNKVRVAKTIKPKRVRRKEAGGGVRVKRGER